MIRRRTVVALLTFVFVGLSIACDTDDAERSPTPTIGTAPAPDDPDDEIDDHSDEIDDPSELDDIDLDPDSEPDQHWTELPEGTPQQQARLQEGKIAFLSDDFDEAIEIFEELALDEPVTGDTVSAAIALAQIYNETGRSEEALVLFKKLQDHVAHIPEVLLVLARTFHDLGKPNQALTAYDRAYELKPQYVFILPEMAQLLVETGEEEKAATLLGRYESRIYDMVQYLVRPEETTAEERLMIVDVFALLNDEAVNTALQVALESDPSEQVRAAAAKALADGAVFEAEEVLTNAAVEDDSEAVRLAARNAVESLRNLREQYGLTQ